MDQLAENGLPSFVEWSSPWVLSSLTPSSPSHRGARRVWIPLALQSGRACAAEHLREDPMQSTRRTLPPLCPPCSRFQTAPSGKIAGRFQDVRLRSQKTHTRIRSHVRKTPHVARESSLISFTRLNFSGRISVAGGARGRTHRLFPAAPDSTGSRAPDDRAQSRGRGCAIVRCMVAGSCW